MILQAHFLQVLYHDEVLDHRHTAIGTVFSLGFFKHSTDAKKLFKSQCNMFLILPPYILYQTFVLKSIAKKNIMEYLP